MLMKQTAYRVDLSINIITRHNGQPQELATVNLLALTKLIFWLWAIIQMVDACRYATMGKFQAMVQIASVAGKLLQIIFNTVTFAMGVDLCP